MFDAPLSLCWPRRQTPVQLDAAWNPTQSPHSHHQWPPPSCPWPITQNITINFCPAAKQHTQQSLQSDSALLVHVKIALSELDEKGKRLVMMAFYTRHKTYCGVLCFVVCGDAVALPVEQTFCPLQQLLCSIWGWWKMCPSMWNCLKHATSLRAPRLLLAWQIVPFSHCLNLGENWRINRGLIEKTTHTWCYGNDGLSLFVCISEEQAQIVNECFASSV